MSTVTAATPVSDLHFARYPSLEDRVVLITGGASGIGGRTVRRLAEQGAQVLFVDLNEEAAAEVLADTRGARHAPLFRACDLRDVAASQRAITELMDEGGTPYALLNNAAHDERHDWREMTPELWDERFATNLRHQFFAIQTVAPRMFEAGVGSIVNVGSNSWMMKMHRMIAYTTAKSAVHGITRSLVQEFGGHGVRVNTLIPGWVMTERQRTKWLDPAGDAELKAGQALPGYVEPDDLANMMLFLCADDSRMCTGQQFFVEGGWL